MKKLPVEGGGFALVDDEDYERASVYLWKPYFTPGGKEYIRANGELTLHRFILGFPAGKDVDHRNHDTRDNRKENLRVTTRSQNQQNRKGLNKNNRTGVRGVHYDPSRGRYVASVKVNRVRVLNRRYDTLEDAAMAVLSARLAHMTHSDGR